MSQPIIQPGQIECEHLQDPSGRDPLAPDKVVRGQRVMTFGGLTCREEIASRILPGVLKSDFCKNALEQMPNAEDQRMILIEESLRLTDALLAKTRQQPDATKTTLETRPVQPGEDRLKR